VAECLTRAFTQVPAEPGSCTDHVRGRGAALRRVDDQSCEMKRMFVSLAAQHSGAGQALGTELLIGQSHTKRHAPRCAMGSGRPGTQAAMQRPRFRGRASRTLTELNPYVPDLRLYRRFDRALWHFCWSEHDHPCSRGELNRSPISLRQPQIPG
jgi:hypothetical protein